MNFRVTGRAVFLLLFTTAIVARPSITFGDDNPSSTLRGYTEVNHVIHERIARTNKFELGEYLGDDSAEPTVGRLLALLGTYVGSSTDGDYRNGDPNSVNTLLWYVALSQFAQDIADQCNKPQPVPSTEVLDDPSPSPSPSSSASPPPPKLALKANFRAALLPMCNWPAVSAKTDDALFNYWSALLSFDAPPEEFAAWKDYFLNDSEYANAPAGTALSAMTLAALFNPYFLLRN